MFEVHSLSGLSQTKLRMECTPVQTEPSLIIKAWLGLSLIHWSVIVKNLSGGEGKNQSVSLLICVNSTVIQGHKSMLSLPCVLSLLSQPCHMSGRRYSVPATSEWQVVLWCRSLISSQGTTLGENTGCNEDKKWLGTEREKPKRSMLGKAIKKVLWRGYWQNWRETLRIQTFLEQRTSLTFSA